MEIVAMLFLQIVWPIFVGLYAGKRGFTVFEAIGIGLLPLMMVLALK